MVSKLLDLSSLDHKYYWIRASTANALNVGVNTGFGGSADTRTDRHLDLQKALMQLLQAGVTIKGHEMPTQWVRAMILVRCNTLMRGHSAVSLSVIESLCQLLCSNLTPVVPVRGTISASGDLMPLAYVAGVLEGNQQMLVQVKDGRTIPANQALQIANLRPVVFGPKEALGLVNGTAASAGLGALVAFHAQQLAVLTQALTALAVEVKSSNCLHVLCCH